VEAKKEIKSSSQITISNVSIVTIVTCTFKLRVKIVTTGEKAFSN